MDNPTAAEVQDLLRRLEEMKPGLEKLASAGPINVPDDKKGDVTPDMVSYEDVCRLRREFLTWSENDIHRAIGQQLIEGTKEGYGTPMDKWATASAAQAMFANPFIAKLLDTAGSGPLIRQDLEPLLYAAFVKPFPWFDRITKKPANGLVHAYNRIDALPTAAFISDTGAVTDSASTYTRATTNIAIAALRVGTSLKAQFAVRAGGMGYNPEQEEIRNGITALAKKVQAALFSGNDSVPGKVATDVEGLYDGNGFNGLRITVPAANIKKIAVDETILEAFNTLDGDTMGVKGGTASIILMDGRDRVKLMNELQPHVRFVDRIENVVPGLPGIEAVNLGASGRVPVLPIPGDEMGTYNDGAENVRDAYLLDESVIAAPWLGSESPTVLEIPVGVGGTLTRLYILFMMVGLEVAVPNFIAKLRLT